MNIADSGEWTLAVTLGIPIFIALFGISLLLIAMWLVRGLEPGDGFFISLLSLVPIGLVVGCLVGYYPYKAEHHQWRQVTGQVTEVSRRLVSDGDAMSEKIVVRFKDSYQEFGCEDTRCALVKPDDHLTLRCKKIWVYSGTDGYDCRFVRRI